MTEFSVIGNSVPRIDLRDKVTGEARYTSDIALPGMLCGKIIRSPHPHATILSVDTTKIESHLLSGAILTPFNVGSGNVAPDIPILDRKVRFVGDEVGAIAGTDEFESSQALSLVDVEYEILPFSPSTDSAMAVDSEPIHPGGNLVNGAPIIEQRGSVLEGFDQADVIVEGFFSTPGHASAALEPRSVLSSWEGRHLTVWKSSRGVHVDRANIAASLNISLDDITVIGSYMGGGFGGKDETRTASISALLAKRTGRPVKIELSREEEFLAGRRRHSTKTTVRIGVTREGNITAIDASTVMDTGAYLSSGPGVIRRAGQGFLYLYRCANVRYTGYLVYTNTPSAGSYRALGAPQGHFALESMIDEVAEKIDIDPLEFRLRNHVSKRGQPGERVTPVDQIVDTQPVEGGIPFSSNGLADCLKLGSQAINWDTDDISAHQEGPVRHGKGMSMFLYRGGPGGTAEAHITLNRQGDYEVSVGIMDVGEGSVTVLAQMASEILGTDPRDLLMMVGNTSSTPKAGFTAGSTVTFSSGLAVKSASMKLKRKLLVEASHITGEAIEGLSLVGKKVESISGSFISLSDITSVIGDIKTESKVNPGSSDYIVNSFGAHFVELEVDTETGLVKILRYVASHDSGKIINPKMAENQVRGGISQMLGFTLTEDMEIDPVTGIPINTSFLEHKSPMILDVPPIEVIFTDVKDPIGPFGAKSLGEPPSIGPAPAIANAIYDAIGIRITKLPITSTRILEELNK